MTESPPIACTLTAEELPAREAQIRALGRDGLLSITHEEQRVLLRFREDADLRRRIDGLVEAESSCCAFFEFRVEAEGDGTIVTVAAPEGAEPALHHFAGLFMDGASGQATLEARSCPPPCTRAESPRRGDGVPPRRGGSR